MAALSLTMLSPFPVYLDETIAGGPGPQNGYIGAGMLQTRVVRGI